jgi:hypothetical protein
MMIKPSTDLKMDLYADADFAGLWNAEDSQDPTCVKSRTGYVVTLGGVPVLWGSKLQTEITLSSTESEYVALSMAMRQLLPLRALMEEISASLQIERDSESTISTVWEDNNGALILANAPYPNMTPRTKHIAVKYHWFREHIKTGEIEVKRIDTHVQKADIFTKGLGPQDYAKKRMDLVGW